MNNGIGHVWAVNAEGGDEGRPNGVGPVWIENADQLGSKLPEPEAGDAGKVLGVLNAEGDIGWVPDQEGMAQVQADWDQTDSSQVSYIANKPSLATVATTGAYSDLSGTPTIPTVDQTYDASSANAQSGVAVASAVSGKQDTISDLSTIRSGASAGATAVQPAALNDYATTSALTSGLAAKQDTISDLATIRSGASAGATAVQPGDLATVATTGSYDDLSDKPTIPSTKPLVAGTNITITENTNDVTISAAGGASYTAGGGIDITNNVISADTAVLATKSDLSAYTPTASLATVATTGSYSDLSNKPTIPSVDQTYNAASTNAQSGVAVAQAIAAIPSTSYTAGDGISIENDEISAKLGDGLEIGTSLSPVTVAASAVGCSNPDTGVTVMQPLSAELVSAIETAGLTYTVQNLTDNNNVSQPWVYGGVTSLKLYPAIFAMASYGTGPVTDTSMRLVLSTTGIDVASSSGTIPAGTQFTYNLDDVNTSLSTITWETISDQPEHYSLGVTWQASWGGWSCLVANGSYTKNALYESGTLSYQTATPGAITVTNPLPAVTSTDDGKVLKAKYSGGAGSYAWESEPTMVGIVAGANVTVTEGASDITIAATDTTYTAGNMIAIDANNSNAIGVSTTAGITDIQQVASLPASPVSTVLYLIPET